MLTLSIFLHAPINDVSRFRNSTDTVSQRVLESVDDELHRQFDEDTWSIRFQNSEEEMGLEDPNHHSEEEMDLEDPIQFNSPCNVESKHNRTKAPCKKANGTSRIISTWRSIQDLIILY